MRIMRIVLALGLTAMLPAAPSVASPECELFLLSGPYVGYHDDPAFVGCAPGAPGGPSDTLVPGGPYDTSILMPGALGAYGFVRGPAASDPPTHASITVKDVDGRETRTPVTFRWQDGGDAWPFLGGNWVTNEYVDLGPRAMGAVIVARFGGRVHHHEYGRLMPPKPSGGPTRSGVILGGLGEARACTRSPECVGWLTFGCMPRLAGRDPALASSIVDVRELAGSVRRRVLGWPYGGWLDSMWEFWTSDCERISGSLSDSRVDSIRIPRNAYWMTVTAPIGPYTWELW